MVKLMEIIPAIDIRGGRCVRLYQGDYSQETAYADDPAAVALRFQEIGATRLHVVDLDGAREGRPVNTEAIKRIAATVTVPVQVGGGLRRLEDMDAYLNTGVAEVILGTTAITNPSLLTQAVHHFPGRVMAAIDARDGLVAVEGWQKTTPVAASELARRLTEIGVRRLVYTDILRDGTLTGPNFTAIQEMVAAVDADVVASGGIASLEHLQRLAQIGAAGAIVGRALYTGDLDLRQALEVMGELRPGR